MVHLVQLPTLNKLQMTSGENMPAAYLHTHALYCLSVRVFFICVGFLRHTASNVSYVRCARAALMRAQCRI